MTTTCACPPFRTRCLTLSLRILRKPEPRRRRWASGVFATRGWGAGVSARVERVKRAAGTAPVKAILETGVLEDGEMIAEAARLAIQGGADFIKTSTGKVKINATLEAADIMLGVIRQTDRKVGIKPAGGISSVRDAQLYLSLAETVMGEGWVMPTTFRFGASGLLNDIQAVLDGKQSSAASSGY
mgnify:CR=1 FL=1